MRNIKDLKPNECIKISTKKEACKLVKILNESGLKRSSGEKITFKWIWDEKYPYLSTQLGYVDIYNNPPGIIISTSEFLPKKHKRKKQLYNGVMENTHDIQALQSAFKILADKVDSLPIALRNDEGVIKLHIPGLKLEDSVTITPEALLFEPAGKPEPLTELPENWYISVNNRNRDIIEKWRSGLESLRNKTLSYGLYVNQSGRGFSGIPESTEISTEDFKRLVLKENVLEVGKWYKRKQGCLFLFSGKYDKTDNLPMGCGFIVGKEFVSCDTDTGWGLSEGDSWIIASNKEVEAALINEAKKREFKDNIEMMSNGSKVYLSEDNGCFELSGNCLWFGGYIIFRNGIWAEIIEPVKEEIDWSKPGLYISINGYLVQSTGVNDLEAFEGITVTGNDKQRQWEFSKYWHKSLFDLYTGEPITLSN